MQTITITLTVPDGVNVAVATSPPAVEIPTPAPVETKPAGPTDQDLRAAFLLAVRKDKAKAFAALGVATLADVPADTYGAVIEKLKGV